MKVMVIGKGGREHAIVKALSMSPSVQSIFALPGNKGMTEAECVSGSPSDHQAVAKACLDRAVDLVVVGPENPLAEGLSEALRARGLAVFGPDQRAAQLEASKTFSKKFMDKYEIPTAQYFEVTSVEGTAEAAEKFDAPYVLKADGLAAGKGVIICQTKEELLEAADQYFNQKIFGEAGSRAILEDFQSGYELSYFILTNGENYVSLPLAQDHKKLGEGDMGPNTGGMGTVAPMAISDADHQAIKEQILDRTIAGFREENFLYRGVVFIGLMMTDNGPRVIEYNIRFGDPETQVLLPLLEGDWGQAMLQIAKGELPQLSWKDKYTTCVVLAAENYPGPPKKGVEITGDVLTSKNDSYVLHAGTKEENGKWLTDGGRVLNVMGMGSTMQEAIKASYDRVNTIQWPGMQFRKDIGKKALQ